MFSEVEGFEAEALVEVVPFGAEVIWYGKALEDGEVKLEALALDEVALVPDVATALVVVEVDQVVSFGLVVLDGAIVPEVEVEELDGGAILAELVIFAVVVEFAAVALKMFSCPWTTHGGLAASMDLASRERRARLARRSMITDYLILRITMVERYCLWRPGHKSEPKR